MKKSINLARKRKPKTHGAVTGRITKKSKKVPKDLEPPFFLPDIAHDLAALQKKHGIELEGKVYFDGKPVLVAYRDPPKEMPVGMGVLLGKDQPEMPPPSSPVNDTYVAGTFRGGILYDAREVTEGSRQASYGNPRTNLGYANKIKNVFREGLVLRASLGLNDLDPAAIEAFELMLTKLGRVVTGTANQDTFVDGAAYWAIAGEAELLRPQPNHDAKGY